MLETSVRMCTCRWYASMSIIAVSNRSIHTRPCIGTIQMLRSVRALLSVCLSSSNTRSESRMSCFPHVCAECEQCACLHRVQFHVCSASNT